MTQNAIYKKWLMPFCKAWLFHNDLFWKGFKHHANIIRPLSYSLINTNPITPLVTIIGHVYCFTLLLPVKRCFQFTGFFFHAWPDFGVVKSPYNNAFTLEQ